jgi:transposase
MRTNYPSSLTDAEWSCLQQFLPPRSPKGRLRRHSLRTVFDALFKKIWADSAYRGKELANWRKAQDDWDLEVVERTPGVRGFSVLPKRWIVERTFGWLSRNRRMSKDYERKVQTSETLIEVAMIRLLIARLGRRPSGYSPPPPT